MVHNTVLKQLQRRHIVTIQIM